MIACPSSGYTTQHICSGCRVPGFGDHSCTQGTMAMNAAGKDALIPCRCSVFTTCHSHAPPSMSVPGLELSRDADYGDMYLMGMGLV